MSAATARRLRRAGQRVTSQRLAVAAALSSSPRQVTAQELWERMRPRHRRLGRATVFRTMKLLTDLNILCRVLLEDGALHYRLSTRGHHHHLVCRDCGRVEDFSKCDVEPLVRELARATDYEIEGHWLEVYGRCETCRLLKREVVSVG